MKVIVDNILGSGDRVTLTVDYIRTDTNTLQEIYDVELFYGTDIVAYTLEEIQTATIAKILAHASDVFYTVSASDIIWSIPNTSSPKVFTNNATHSFVTTAGAANGFQLSATRHASVSYSVQISTTATIGGASSGYVVLEIAATNSATAGDWKEISRVTNSQTITLAIALQSVQISGGALVGIVPTGYYARLRTVNVSGTPTYIYNSGQEVLL